MIKEEFIAAGVVAAAVVGALWYAKRQVGALIPATVKEGAEAAGVLAVNAADALLHPLNAFGISPANDATGAPTWAPTVPWKSDDPVSNNDSGMNFNLF